MFRRKPLILLFDLGLVVLAVVALWPYARSHWAAKTSPAPALITTGAALNLPGVRFSEADRHIVLFVQSTCPACNDSATFYRTLAGEVRKHQGVRMVVVSSEAPEPTRTWLAAAGVDPHQVVQSDLPALGISLIPSLLFVDRTGRVTDAMLEKLSAVDEGRVLARVRGDAMQRRLDNTEYARETSEATYGDLRRTRAAQLVDARSREDFASGHRPEARNVPSDELEVRAKAELNPSAPVVVDCAGLALGRCRSYGHTLTYLGFEVLLLVRP